MGYIIMACFSVYLLFASGVMQRDIATAAITAESSTQQQQAAEIILYLNAINDWLYDHPQSDGIVSNTVLDTQPPRGTTNILSQGRLYVYQPEKKGLAAALMDQSNQSALIGRVTNRRLTDMQGKDMQVTVPDVIPNGYLVYLN